MKHGIRLLVAVVGLLVLSACSSTDVKEETPATTVDRSSSTTGTATDLGSAQTSGMQPGGASSLQALDDPASPLSQRIIYFEFDSSTIKQESQTLLAQHARFLADNGGLKIRLEGHADERGSREYNLGLGERRARAVERVLVLNGAGAAQLDPISYGEERPVALGHTEESLWQNRRVEIVYPGH